MRGMPKRIGFLLFGLLMVGFGLVGAFLPLMPTTIFLILAVWAFGRSSERLETWLLNHPRFGKTLRDWREHGAMSRRAKLGACLGIGVGYALFWQGAHPGPWVAAGVALVMAACAAYLVTRPASDTAGSS